MATMVVLFLLIVGTVTHAHTKRSTAQRAAALKGDWAALEGCLLGAPLGEGESPSSRFRAVQLTVLGTARQARGNAKEAAWPVRCASFAEGVANRADAAGAEAVDVRIPMTALAKSLREDTNATADLGKLIDQTWKVGGTAKLLTDAGKPETPANPASAPRPTVPVLTGDAFGGSASFAGDFDLKSVKVDPAPSANLRFLIDDRRLTGGAEVCSTSGTPTALSCERAPTEVATSSPGLALVGTTDVNAFPWIFAGDRGQLGIYGPSGRLALRGEPAWGASVEPDDSAWLLVHVPGAGPNSLGLIHAPRTGDVPAATPVLDANELATPGDATLVWNWLIDWTGPRASLPHHLVAHAIGPQGDLGPPIDIGREADAEPADLADAEPRFTACRSGDHLAVRLHGARADVLTFYTGVAWTAPVAIHAQGGDLICEENEAVVTQVTHANDGAAVVQSRCNAGGCKESRVAIPDLLAGTDVLPKGAGSFAAAELNDQMLIVWNADPLGGLRMRLAPMDRLVATGDIVVADTQRAKPEDMITDIKLVAAAKEALLFVKTGAGVHLYGVDGAGKLASLRGRL